MSTPEKDRTYYEAGLNDLEQYLLSKELYWTASASTPDLTQLTPGGLLLVRARLRGWRADTASLDARLEAVRAKWRSAWETKASREVRARSELWKNFLSDYQHDPRGVARQYSQNVRHRVIIALLGETSDPMDNYLHSVLIPGEFVWDAQLQSGFPRDVFWFMYGNLNIEEKS